MALFEVAEVSLPTDEETYLLLDADEVDRKVHLVSNTNLFLGFTEAQADTQVLRADQLLPSFILPAGKQLWGRTTVASNAFRYMTTVAR